MRLRNIAILAMKGADVKFKREMAKEIGVSIQTYYRMLNTNDDHLTKASGMRMIRQLTGLTDEELLEDDEVEKEGSTKHTAATQPRI